MTETTTLKQATHEGKLIIGETEFPCAVLKDGTRIISRNSIFKAFGRTKRGRGKDIRVPNMPAFIDARNLQAFIDENLKGVLKPIEYINKNGKQDEGYNALILPQLCKVYFDARATINEKTGRTILTKQQLPLARASEILLLGLSKVGIIALVDEATGYQYDREKQELQAILQLFVSEEILGWQRTFELSFYKEIFRLWGIPFTAENIRRKPLFIGKLTSELVYKNMPKGIFVLDKLKEKTPKTKGGNYRYKLHQSLTPDIGREELKKVINSIETLASISETKEQFKKFVENRYGNKNRQLTILFDELDKPETKKISQPTHFDKQLKGLLAVPPPPKGEQ